MARKVGGHLRGSVGTELAPTGLVNHVTLHFASLKSSAVHTIPFFSLPTAPFLIVNCVELPPRPVDHFPVLRGSIFAAFFR